MISPEEARAEYRSALGAFDTVRVRRYTGTGTARPFFDVPVRARVSGLSEGELVGALQEGDRRVILLAEDLELAQFPLPLRSTDKLLVGDKEFAIVGIDDRTRSIGGVLIAYQFGIRG